MDDHERQAARCGLVVGQPRLFLLRIGVGRTLHDREPRDGAECEPRGLAGVVARDLAHALRRLDQQLPRLIGAPRGDSIGAERVSQFLANRACRVDDGDLALHLHAAHHQARKDRRAEGADRRRQHQAEDERPREDRGHEFPDRRPGGSSSCGHDLRFRAGVQLRAQDLGVRRVGSARDDADEDVLEARPGDLDASGRDGAGEARDGGRRVRARSRAGSRSRRPPARRARLRGAPRGGERSASRSSGSNRIARGSYWRRIVDSGSSSTFLPRCIITT